MAAIVNKEEQELRNCLDRIGWNERQRTAIVAGGFGGLEDLGEMLLKDVSNVCSTISKLWSCQDCSCPRPEIERPCLMVD